MACAEDRALLTLSEELVRLDQQIHRLLERQSELHRQRTRLEESRDAAFAAVSNPVQPARWTPTVVCFTPAPGGAWERQRGRGKRVSPLPSQPDFASANRFEVLSSSPSTLIVGDSIVRHLKVSNAKGNAAVSCFPGARVLDVARRLPMVLRHRGDPGTVILHVGTNDTSARRSEVLKEHFRTLLDTAHRLTRARLLISGPMPTYRRGSQPFSRLYALHCWLRDWCSASGLIFYLDNWESFRERPGLFHRDGLHPSRLGSTVLSGNIEAVLRRD
uniref:SGNH hydrolase-type esterase domain-containing protein n=1 Tax=Astyanax mexicanus TaxID=7994 RepID=A0A3B1KBZ8_ASTMX